ncbi:MAG: UDP-N-acetylmuramoyl-L-alanyl-D-glutamate--2,6-diaminopimelate ligase [Planctomycetaceae bacterium]|nr:UDP-N-acetylmuramoyl-L-alanyl-D-glutamate--2,6-diaminopimelate ligase [Planctomycetaceae bacterium]
MKITVDQIDRLLPQAQLKGQWPARVSHITADSRQVQSGSVFAAVSGSRHDGHLFAADAVRAGATALVVERHLPELDVPQAVVSSSAQAFAVLVTASRLGTTLPTLAGVTGTNGKTTTTWMLQSILKAAALTCGRMGTVDCDDGQQAVPTALTTPSADQLADWLQRLQSGGGTHAVLEVSSHALHQHRCDGLHFAAGAITNITRDHLDYHETTDAYHSAKAQLADLMYPDAPLLINADDAGCRRIEQNVRSRCRVLTYGLDSEEVELRGRLLESGHRRQRVHFSLAQGDAEVNLRLIGRHNASNALAAAGMAEQLGMPLAHIVSGLESLRIVPGRLERVDAGQPFQVFIDYAHTPDALQQAVGAVRSCAPGRIICVFGAGGERDRPKRPLMGAATAQADLRIVTSDNPRSECPQQIIREIAAGFTAEQPYHPVVDRQAAIRQALECAQPGDAVLIAGKGHETTQEIGDQSLTFDDRAVARDILRDLNSQSASDLHPVFTLPRSA